MDGTGGVGVHILPDRRIRWTCRAADVETFQSASNVICTTQITCRGVLYVLNRGSLAWQFRFL